MRFAFLGRTSDEDAQDPSLSIPRQLASCEVILKPRGDNATSILTRPRQAGHRRVVRARPARKEPPRDRGVRPSGLAHRRACTIRLPARAARAPQPEQGPRRQAQAPARDRPRARPDRGGDLRGLLHPPARLGEICQKLNRNPERFPPPIPNRKDENGLPRTWSRSVINAILRNPKYTGFNVGTQRQAPRPPTDPPPR